MIGVQNGIWNRGYMSALSGSVISASPADLRVGNTRTVDGVTYQCVSQALNGSPDVANVGIFGDWPGVPGGIIITGVAAGRLLAWQPGDSALTVEFVVTAATPILTGCRISFFGPVPPPPGRISMSAIVADEPLSAITEFLSLLATGDEVANGPNVFTQQVTFAGQTSMSIEFSGIGASVADATIDIIGIEFFVT